MPEQPIDGQPSDVASANEGNPYVELIMLGVTRKRLCLRDLAQRSELSRSRLGRILHRNPNKRSSMTLDEFEVLANAIGMDVLDAVISAETFRGRYQISSQRYSTLLPMLCRMFRSLPSSMIDALNELEDMDGSEVRMDWAPALQRAIIRRIVHEVSAVIGRRASIAELSLFA